MYLVHNTHPYYINNFLKYLKYGRVVVNKKFYRSVHNQCTRSKFSTTKYTYHGSRSVGRYTYVHTLEI